MKSLLMLALFSSYPATVHAADAGSPSAELLSLERAIIQSQDEWKKGRVTAEQHQASLAGFRSDLPRALEKSPSSSANIAVHSRILTLLGDRAAAIQDLKWTSPGETALALSIGQTYYEQANYAAAFDVATKILEREPKNDAALFLKHSSAGRVAPNTSTKTDLGASASASRGARADIVFSEPLKKKTQADIPLDSSDESSPGDGKPIPLWPLLPVAGLGAGAFVVSKSRKTVESEEGYNADDRPQPGELQRFVAGSILSGLAAAALYLGGGFILSVGAPLATRWMSGSGQQTVAMTQIEARAIAATNAAAPNANVAAEKSAEVVRQVIKKGEILNRVWDSRHGVEPHVSGPAGSSYCWGQCLPLDASIAIQRRGLSGISGLTNNAQSGAAYRVTEDIVVRVQKSIGGVDPEVVVSKADIGKLQLIAESVSKIPPGAK